MASEEYTIDIQLTELGFPNIMLASSDTSSPPSSPSPPPPPQSADEESPRGGGGGGIQISMVRGGIVTPLTAVAASSQRGGATPRSLLSANGLERMGRVHPGNGQEQTATGQAHGAGRLLATRGGVEVELEESESDSDDSEVSEVEDEEEEDDEDVEGEGVNVDIESTSGDFRCSVCELTLPSSVTLQEHMNQHTGTRPYCCAECGKRFCQIYNYRLHLRTHAQTRVKPVVCRICLKDFDTDVQLQFHLTQTHFEKEFYECDLCKRIFTDLRLCEQHMEWHQRSVKCETCGRAFHSERALKRHRHKRCQRTYNCTDCALKFSRKNALLKHSFTHLGLLPYTCIRCRRHFRLAKLYRQHKCEPQSIHCVACLRVFYNQVDFQKHKKDTGCWGHQGSKGDEIRCMECGKSFSSKEELKKHAGVHQRLLSCAECGKGFHSALLLMSHMGGHAGQSPCLCQQCGLGFPHQQEYDGHLKHCGRARPLTKRPPSSKTDTAPPAKKVLDTRTRPPEVLDTRPRIVVIPSVPDHPPGLTLVSANPPRAPSSSSVNHLALSLSNGPTLRLDSSSSSSATTAAAGGGVSMGGPSGVWQIALDKRPPPGANLVLFVPVASPLANGLAGINQGQPALQLLQAQQLSAALQAAAAGAAAGGGGGALHKATSLFPGLSNAVLTQLGGLGTPRVDNGADMMPLDLSTKKPASVESSSSPSSPVESCSVDAPRPSVKKEPESLEEPASAAAAAAADRKPQLSVVKREELKVKSEAAAAGESAATVVDESHVDLDSSGELSMDLDVVGVSHVDLDSSGELTMDLDVVDVLHTDVDSSSELTMDLDAVDDESDLESADESTAGVDAAANVTTAGPDTVDESTAGPDTVDESTAGPDTVDESTAGPDTVDESTAGPDTVGESTAGPDTVDESTAGPDTVDESTAGLDTVGESTAGPDAVDESTAGPDTVDESTAGPDTVDESTAGPDTVDESTAGPDTAASETQAGPDTVGESTAGLESAESTAGPDTVDESTADLESAESTAGLDTAASETQAGPDTVDESTADLETAASESKAQLGSSAGETRAQLDTETTAEVEPSGETEDHVDDVEKEPETPS